MSYKYYNVNRPTDNRALHWTQTEVWPQQRYFSYLWPRAWGFVTYPDRLSFQAVLSNGLYPAGHAEALCYRAWREHPGDPEGFLEGYFSSYNPGELEYLAVEKDDFWAAMIMAWGITPEQVENVFIRQEQSNE